MRVKRDFDQIYKEESDPWNIGDANSERYNLYYQLINQHSREKKSLLDIGCGFGGLLSRFKNDFSALSGIELSSQAVSKGKEKYPFIQFHQGSTTDLHHINFTPDKFDTIIFSDVIYYLNESEKNNSLKWIHDHLNENGLAFVAAWCPGGDYLDFSELSRLVEKNLAVESSQLLDSGHGLFLTRKRKNIIAVTIDYETWHPIPKNKTINWENDIFQPTEKLLQIFNKLDLKLTLFAEMGEYFWLRENDPAKAKKMEDQWSSAIRDGHDVQLHLHPNWLPELGANFKNNSWYWDWNKSKADDYPGSLIDLIKKCKDTLESILKKVDSSYRVTSFRAGTYQAQPFSRLYEALTANDIHCDTSVYAGGISEERGYDYSVAYSNHQPYFANRFDPQLKAPPAEQGLVEIPVFTYEPNQRWFMDDSEGKVFADRLLNYLDAKFNKRATSESYRCKKRLWAKIRNWYYSLKPFHKRINPLIPKSITSNFTEHKSEALVTNEFFVMIGHTKANLYFDDITENLKKLKSDSRFEFATLTEMADMARGELLSRSRNNSTEEADYQVKLEYNAILGDERNEAQSYFLQEMIPWDRKTVLDFGCGAGYWSERISQLYPWMKVVGIDWGKDFISKAQSKYSNDKVSFQIEDFSNLSFSDNTFDCVYADNVLEHSFDVDKVLSEIYRVLNPGGILLAAVPSDARNPDKICVTHTWKTAPHEVRMRLEKSGFIDIDQREIDTFKELGMPPYPPSDDKMIYIKARRRSNPASETDRALEAMNWTYNALDPEKPSSNNDPKDILTGGFAWCMGYSIVLGKLLERENYNVEWITMVAEGHPKGSGPNQQDTHEVIQLTLCNGSKIVLDPQCNIYYKNSIDELIEFPENSNIARTGDQRYTERQYALYSTPDWYGKVVKYAVRKNPDENIDTANFHMVKR